jgi:hypothetical protein
LYYRTFPLENEEKTGFLLGEYFASNFFFDTDRELGFSPLKSVYKTVPSDVYHAIGVTGRCNDGRSPVDSPIVSIHKNADTQTINFD